MNSFILSRLSPEFAALYRMASERKIDPRLQEILRYRVQSVRPVREGNDKLFQKLRTWGNNGEWGRAQLRELARVLYTAKAPSRAGLGQYVSAEIECIFPDEEALSTFAKYCRANGLSQAVTIKNDGSVHDEEAEDCVPKEIVVTWKHSDATPLRLVCAELVRLGVYVNKTCGLHVHFDCRHLNARQVGTLGRRLALAVPALKLMLPESRQNNQYCRDTINKMRGGSRYAFVNLQSFTKHGTLEVRGHSGTVDAQKILHWVALCQLIMGKRNTAAVTTVAGLIATYQPNAELGAYVLARAAKFSQSAEVVGPMPADADEQAESAA